MLLTKMTTVTELLASGASIEGARGESLSQLMSVVSIDSEWVHDLPVISLMKKDSVIRLKSGLSVQRCGDKVALHDDLDREVISVYEMTDEGFAEMSDTLIMADMSPAVHAASASQHFAFA